MSARVEVPCPVEGCTGPDGALEPGVVVVELEWEPADHHYGADADGNRGVYVPGYWYDVETSATCSKGCELTERDRDAAVAGATALTEAANA